MPTDERCKDDDYRNTNMMRLAWFSEDSRQAVVRLAVVVSESRDLIDAQTVVDTIAAVLDDLTHQYQAAQRKRDGFRK